MILSDIMRVLQAIQFILFGLLNIQRAITCAWLQNLIQLYAKRGHLGLELLFLSLRIYQATGHLLYL